MLRTRRGGLALVAVLGWMLWLTACTPAAPPTATIAPAAPAATATPRATREDAPSATPQATAKPTAKPTAIPTPAEWQDVSGKGFRLRLPAGWTTLDLAAGDAQAVFGQFARANPDLAKALGGPEALQGVELWAFAPATNAGFADSLNVRRSRQAEPPGEDMAGEDMAGLLSMLEAQYAKFDFIIEESDAARTIGGLPAAYLRYHYELAEPNGAALRVTGHQYVLAAEADLWILSFSAGPAAREAFERESSAIAASFRVDGSE